MTIFQIIDGRQSLGRASHSHSSVLFFYLHSTKNKSCPQFIPFAERINAIDIRHAALYHIEHEYTKRPEENDTHFSLAIQKWHVLNLTENFKKFKRDVFGTFSVAQLVHKKEDVIETLEKYLNLEDPLCLQPLLE